MTYETMQTLIEKFLVMDGKEFSSNHLKIFCALP
jgi:hypothetical protein